MSSEQAVISDGTQDVDCELTGRLTVTLKDKRNGVGGENWRHDGEESECSTGTCYSDEVEPWYRTELSRNEATSLPGNKTAAESAAPQTQEMLHPLTKRDKLHEMQQQNEQASHRKELNTTVMLEETLVRLDQLINRHSQGLRDQEKTKHVKLHTFEAPVPGQTGPTIRRIELVGTITDNPPRGKEAAASACFSPLDTVSSRPLLTDITGLQDAISRGQPVERRENEGHVREEDRGMRLRSGRMVHRASSLPHDFQSHKDPEAAWLEQGSDEGYGAPMCPIMKKGGVSTYVPWSFMDMVGLAERLPDLSQGAGKWITALEESTAGVTLALGDIKALLMKVVGKHATVNIFENAKLGRVCQSNLLDDVNMGMHRTVLWEALRKQYPDDGDPSSLEGEVLKDEECPSKWLHAFQRKWKDETGSAWNANKSTEALFKSMVKKGLPAPAQQKLEQVVGLSKMDWPLFVEHIVHHVNYHRKEKQREEETNKHLTNKLTQLQLGELTKNKKEKTKTQAPLITTLTETQAPVIAATPSQNYATPPPQAETVFQPAASSAHTHISNSPAQTGPALPAIHVYVNQGENSYPQGRGRGREAMRGGLIRRGRGRGGQLPTFRLTQPNPQQSNVPKGDIICWSCDQPGHLQRDCPVNPWTGPSANWL
ncbi:unnamed protein product [Oreochromis niloticus]|nr:unnamed protein product [Mustela putorius furo]